MSDSSNLEKISYKGFFSWNGSYRVDSPQDHALLTL